ncbi:hypothetical protein [Clostridium sp.]
MQDTLANKSVVDQAYNDGDATPWGFVGTNTNTSGSTGGDIFSTLRYLNGENSSTSSAGKDLTYNFTVKNISVTDGSINITIRNTASQDPLINWIMIVDDSLTHDSLMGLNVTSTTSNFAELSWNKVLGATFYTL